MNDHLRRFARLLNDRFVVLLTTFVVRSSIVSGVSAPAGRVRSPTSTPCGSSSFSFNDARGISQSAERSMQKSEFELAPSLEIGKGEDSRKDLTSSANEDEVLSPSPFLHRLNSPSASFPLSLTAGTGTAKVSSPPSHRPIFFSNRADRLFFDPVFLSRSVQLHPRSLLGLIPSPPCIYLSRHT